LYSFFHILPLFFVPFPTIGVVCVELSDIYRSSGEASTPTTSEEPPRFTWSEEAAPAAIRHRFVLPFLVYFLYVSPFLPSVLVHLYF